MIVNLGLRTQSIIVPSWKQLDLDPSLYRPKMFLYPWQTSYHINCLIHLLHYINFWKKKNNPKTLSNHFQWITQPFLAYLRNTEQVWSIQPSTVTTTSKQVMDTAGINTTAIGPTLLEQLLSQKQCKLAIKPTTLRNIHIRTILL